MNKRVAIVQSNYIPWKGYFDLINSVDEFILYDDVQYTKRDWRNRNQIKTSGGLQWLSVPVEVKGKQFQAIKDARVATHQWRKEHWNSLVGSYGRAPFFREYKALFEPLYLSGDQQFLSEINHSFICAINGALGIKTEVSFSMDYPVCDGDKTDRLLNLCLKAGATDYISGPKAACYLDTQLFQASGVKASFFSYEGYPEYRQFFPPFVHSVTVLDLLFQEGPEAASFLLSFPKSPRDVEIADRSQPPSDAFK